MKSVLLTIAAFVTVHAIAQPATNNQPGKYKPVSQELYNEIAHMDSVMFNAFNEQNLEKLQATFSEDLEFYHDKGGLGDLKQSMENFKTLFEKNKTTGLRRDIVPGSLEVYPIKDYGAVEICSHRFCHKENGKDDCGVFKNIMLWQKKDSQWKVTRVISYDHK
ncbi:MAG: nuclear transport factor 2 family protein [Chitinophagaceae bacterium]